MSKVAKSRSTKDEILAQVLRFEQLKAIELEHVRAKGIADVAVPENSRGHWRIQRFTIGEPDHLIAARSLLRGERGYTPPGTYTRLIHTGINEGRGAVVMSDTLDERLDLMPIMDAAVGSVLVTGLGLGMAVDALLRKPTVTTVTVVEKSKRVIYLTGNYLKDLHGDSLEIIHADAFKWVPEKGVRWDWAWHDVWNKIEGSNLRDMALLRARYRRKIRVMQLCWCEQLARREAA